MARDTDVGGEAISALWRRPRAGGRSIDSDPFDGASRLESDTQYLSDHLRRLKDVTDDPRVVEALRVANLPPKETGT